MTPDLPSHKADAYLKKLCVEIPTRRVGSAGNRVATDFFAATIAACGFATECPGFECMDWTQDGADLSAGETPFHALVSPYSLGGRVHAPLAVVSTIEELEAAPIAGKTVLLCGEIAKEQLMPKNFVFYNPDEHKRIIAALEEGRPQAIVAATARNPEMAGAVYPFPLIEDGDFDIPSVYMTEDEGKRLAAHAGEIITLDIRARRIPAIGCNVVARKGDHRRRVVLFAHIDAKEGTPGATDNATGVVALLLLAELLAGYTGRLGVEIVALNGEDYYAASGEMLYASANAGRFDQIVLGVNLDGAGYYKGTSAYSLYACPPDLAASVRQAFAPYTGIVEGDPWYQGDHGLFLMNKRPALAITSGYAMEILTQIAHTPKDSLEIVDSAKLAEAALALRDVVVLCGSS